jgi:parallel beta-helix repeat protein
MNYDNAIEVGYHGALTGCIISGNEVVANEYNGICVNGQVGIVVANNTVSENQENGMEIMATYGTIENNEVRDNLRFGLVLESSTSYVSVFKNTFLGNGAYVMFSYQKGNSFSDNTVNGRPLVYLYDVDDYVVSGAGQVIAAYSDRLTAEDLNLSDASIGVELWDCDSSTLARLDCSGGEIGIFMVNYSDMNEVSECNMSGCYVNGLQMNTGCCGNTVTDCEMNDTTQTSIFLYWGCDGNVISGCYALRAGSDGARIQQSNDNSLVGCTFGYDTFYCVYLISATGNRVEGCTGTNTMYGFYLSSAVSSYLANNTIRDCSNGGFAIGGDADNNVLFQNVVRNCNWGIRIEGSFPYIAQGNQVLNNTIQLNAGRGISLMNYASGNVIRGNNITSNGYGVYIDGTNTNGNWIYLNNFVANSIQAHNNYAGNKNYWNSSTPLTYVYNGEVRVSYLGNYWSTYAGTDSDLNGIGDTPFSFTNGADNYPLMIEDWNYIPEFPSMLMPLTAMLVVGFVVVLKRRGSGKA